MHMKNDEIVDGWVFSSASGILSTPLGMALTDSLMNHSGLRLWGALEQERGTRTIQLIEMLFKNPNERS